MVQVRLRFKKSSPRWRIVGIEGKIFLIEFLNSVKDYPKINAANGVKYEGVLVFSMIDLYRRNSA